MSFPNSQNSNSYLYALSKFFFKFFLILLNWYKSEFYRLLENNSSFYLRKNHFIELILLEFCVNVFLKKFNITGTIILKLFKTYLRCM